MSTSKRSKAKLPRENRSKTRTPEETRSETKPPSENRDRAKLPPERILPARELLDVKDTRIEEAKLHEIASLLWLPKGLSDEEKQARIVRASELYESIAPQDSIEGMLGEQMVATHFAAKECLRRAAEPDQPTDARDMYLQYAYKLLTHYPRQMEALKKHRDKGQQLVTVKHVNVDAGGQAIVGHVEAQGRGNKTAGQAGAAEPTEPSELERAQKASGDTPPPPRKRKKKDGAAK